jgi:hypothetical protein
VDLVRGLGVNAIRVEYVSIYPHVVASCRILVEKVQDLEFLKTISRC